MAKLSPAQIKALNEIHELGYTNARANTRDSIAGYVTAGDVVDNVQHLKLNEEGCKVLGLEWQGAPSVAEEAQSVQEVMFTSDTTFAEIIGQDPQELHESVEESLYDEEIAKIELAERGVVGWRNTEVWVGLTIEGIKEDIKTGFHINRAARRKHTKLLTSEYRKLMCPRPRKALKITGKVGV